MTNINQALFDPYASTEEQMEDAFQKGFISRLDAEKLVFAADYIDNNAEILMQDYPAQAVSVVADESMPERVAIYPANSVYDAEFKASQFSPCTPVVTLNPFDGLLDYEFADLELAQLSNIVEALTLLDTDDDEMKVLLQESKDDKKKAGDKLADLLDSLIGKVSDDKFAKAFGPRLSGDLPFTGGYIKAGKHANFKDWRVDSQASTSSISKKNFDRLVKKGAKPKSEKAEKRLTAAGIISLPKYSGITMRFVRKGDGGKNEVVECNEPVLIAADIIGADQMKKTKTRLVWDPAAGTADLEKSPPPKKAEKKKK